MDDTYSRTSSKPHLGSVLVLGLGTSGKAVVNYCLELLGTRIDELVVAAGEQNDQALAFAQEAINRGAQVAFETYTFEKAYDLCIASPGISQFSRFYENAAAVSQEILSEVEFAWRESRPDTKWLAITGTNGKTTTTRLTLHILQSAHMNAVAVGNIGDTCIEAVQKNDADIYVTEISSFQLASTTHFKPEAAALLNITPDHLYWHNTFEAYAQAKQKVFANMDKAGLLAIDAVGDITRTIVKDLKANPNACSYVPLGSKAGLQASMIEACGSSQAAWVDAKNDNMLTIVLQGEEYQLVKADDLLIKGEHNISNALAAASLCLHVGVDIEAIRKALKSFKPLEHRLEPCGSIQGISYFNDSKATNVDATMKAFEAFDTKPVFLLGGHDKGTDLEPLVQAAVSTCGAVVCFGAAGARFYEAFQQSGLACILAQNMEQAMELAHAYAQEHGQTEIVLSPACASFDEFSSFEHRGNVFKHLVEFKAQQVGA